MKRMKGENDYKSHNFVVNFVKMEWLECPQIQRPPLYSDSSSSSILSNRITGHASNLHDHYRGMSIDHEHDHETYHLHNLVEILGNDDVLSQDQQV